MHDADRPRRPQSPPDADLAPIDRAHHVVWLGVLVGAILMLIGARFLVVPDSALETFGLGDAPSGPSLHYVVGLRDLWLGALAVAFALWRDWRALGLWLLMGSVVCFCDAAIVSAANGPRLAVAFHSGAGVLCLALGYGSWRRRPKG